MEFLHLFVRCLVLSEVIYDRVVLRRPTVEGATVGRSGRDGEVMESVILRTGQGRRGSFGVSRSTGVCTNSGTYNDARWSWYDTTGRHVYTHSGDRFLILWNLTDFPLVSLSGSNWRGTGGRRRGTLVATLRRRR